MTTLEELVWAAFERIEPETVFKKRKRDAEDSKTQDFDDLPQFAKDALIKMQNEINLLEGLVASQKKELSILKQQMLIVNNTNVELHKTIAVLGAERLLKY